MFWETISSRQKGEQLVGNKTYNRIKEKKN